jgi:S-DNA-T family DNA segregation ATPase FtsK/SpoIIIE
MDFMGRRKKNISEEDSDENDAPREERRPSLKGDAKRSILAVFCVAFAVLFILGYFDGAGSFGGFLDGVMRVTFGWGKWIVPPLLILLAVFFMKRGRATLSDWVKLLGFVLLSLSLLGFFHLYLGDTKDELFRAAQAGQGGGYIGFGLASFLLTFTGKVAGTVILVMLFLIGLIAAFNVSLHHAFEYLGEKMPMRKGDEESVHDEEGVSYEQGDMAREEAESVSLSQDFLPSNESGDTDRHSDNIGNISIEGDQDEIATAGIAKVSFDDDADDESEDFVDDVLPEEKPRRKRRSHAYSWKLPTVDLLEKGGDKGQGGDIEKNKNTIQHTLKYFGIDVEPGEVQVGPAVTQYSFKPAVGVKLSKITTLNNDISLALAKHPIRIEAPIPGKSLIGFEVPNAGKALVRLREAFLSKEYAEKKSPLLVVVGQDVSGKYMMANLAKMPHVLVAGATGTGKSVCINTMLLSLLYQNSPEDLKLILVDPKRVELSFYNGVPHLKSNVITDNARVVNALKWAVREMENRYKILEQAKVRDIESYHEKRSRGEKLLVPREEGGLEEEDMPHLPYIVIVVDEMADLMSSHGKEVERLIVRLAQMSRAIGIHLILATQRPEVTVITGLIKANVPARMAFTMRSQIDSRTILDTGGAEKLLGSGDMLFTMPGMQQPRRLQGIFISEVEVRRVVDFLKKQKEELGAEDIGEDFASDDETKGTDMFAPSPEGELSGDVDPVYEQAKQLVIQTRRAATTYLQTRLSIGYSRAARMMEMLEQNGIIGPSNGAKPREILVGKDGERTVPQYGEDPMAEQIARDKWQA